MLVLSRKVGQQILIGDQIVVTLNRVEGNRVSLGITAPDHVHIMRGELEPITREFRPPVESRSRPNRTADNGDELRRRARQASRRLRAPR